ncbi:MAG: class I fructose-bisphosphate aldolase [Patescibacteria group bacterium]
MPPLDPPRLKDTIQKILTPGKGILAADESSGTIKKRFDSIKVESTEENRRSYRNMLFMSPGYEQWISGVILFDETVDQKDDAGRTFSELIASNGVVPGIKTDEGMEEHPMWAPQKVTRGLKGLGKRLESWTERSKGTLAFTKWRQVVLVEPRVSDAFLDYAMHVMAEQAAWSLAAGYVPINEPEILMDGLHTMEQCAEATERTLVMFFRKLKEHGVDPALTILKTNMVLSGKELKKDAPDIVGKATLEVFRKSLPKELPGIVFLSGGQSALQATENLHACALEAKKMKAPWTLSFSYGRALQDDALKAWAGKVANIPAAQAAFLKRARMNSLAQEGTYDPVLEKEGAKPLARVT